MGKLIFLLFTRSPSPPSCLAAPVFLDPFSSPSHLPPSYLLPLSFPYYPFILVLSPPLPPSSPPYFKTLFSCLFALPPPYLIPLLLSHFPLFLVFCPSLFLFCRFPSLIFLLSFLLPLALLFSLLLFPSLIVTFAFFFLFPPYLPSFLTLHLLILSPFFLPYFLAPLAPFVVSPFLFLLYRCHFPFPFLLILPLLLFSSTSPSLRFSSLLFLLFRAATPPRVSSLPFFSSATLPSHYFSFSPSSSFATPLCLLSLLPRLYYFPFYSSAPFLFPLSFFLLRSLLPLCLLPSCFSFLPLKCARACPCIVRHGTPVVLMVSALATETHCNITPTPYPPFATPTIHPS